MPKKPAPSRPPLSEDTLIEIRKHKLAGLPNRKIAWELGLPVEQVAKSIQRLRRQGRLARFVPQKQRHHYKVGDLRAELNQQDEDFKEWFLASRPEGGCLAAHAISFAVDCYYDEIKPLADRLPVEHQTFNEEDEIDSKAA